MGWWTDIAEVYPGTPNHGGAMSGHDGVVAHTIVGSLSAGIGWCMNPDSGVSAHFLTGKDGTIVQMLDTDITAWTQAGGNGWYGVSIENEGDVDEPLTDPQMRACAAILARSSVEYGHALAVADAPDQPGLGHHSMGTTAEGWHGDSWTHDQCPGSLIKSQKPAIVQLAATGAPSANDTATAVWEYLIQSPAQGDAPAGEKLKAAVDAYNAIVAEVIPRLDQILANQTPMFPPPPSQDDPDAPIPTPDLTGLPMGARLHRIRNVRDFNRAFHARREPGMGPRRTRSW